MDEAISKAAYNVNLLTKQSSLPLRLVHLPLFREMLALDDMHRIQSAKRPIVLCLFFLLIRPV